MITNEQALTASKMDFLTGKNQTEIVKEYAKNLLEARKEAEKHKAEIAELMEGLKYIECLDVNPNTTELSSTARCRMASQKAKELLSQFKRHINT